MKGHHEHELGLALDLHLKFHVPVPELQSELSDEGIRETDAVLVRNRTMGRRPRFGVVEIRRFDFCEDAPDEIAVAPGLAVEMVLQVLETAGPASELVTLSGHAPFGLCEVIMRGFRVDQVQTQAFWQFREVGVCVLPHRADVQASGRTADDESPESSVLLSLSKRSKPIEHPAVGQTFLLQAKCGLEPIVH